ncbi:flavin monoamine oxidase family protein [Maribacter chungangensis]|uniref:Flavin monoamine oxidase family protein n=1 Tax=Maribacter chungangensis TaxID=1069117 RepID=A0ABW3B743_9FLAO
MILILGAGLSGLLTGYRLKKAGIPFRILEARDRIGGRIDTVYETKQAPVEMGATWFTKQHKHLIELLKELELAHFEQYIDNRVFYQTSARAPTQLVEIPGQVPSYRISGGTSRLIHTLYDKLDTDEILLNQSATKITTLKDTVVVHANEVFEAAAVVLSMPPKLWAKRIDFEPGLPYELRSVAGQTHTWMEDSIKIGLTYTHPFWKDQRIPATLFSTIGPVTELYDHCNHQKTKFALCGFINTSFKSQTFKERKASVLTQLKNVFGVKALDYETYQECVWSTELNTFETSDTFLYPHQNNGNPIFDSVLFDDKIYISSSESSRAFPGYMEGAVYAGNLTAEKIINAVRIKV